MEADTSQLRLGLETGVPAAAWCARKSKEDEPDGLPLTSFTNAISTPATLGWHIRSKNRVRYVASRIMWRPACKPR
jgi:hypothetical protein